MYFGTEDRCEPICPERVRIHDRIVIRTDEMVGQGDEVITLFAVTAADFFGGKHTVRTVRMRVQIAAPKVAGSGEGWVMH